MEDIFRGLTETQVDILVIHLTLRIKVKYLRSECKL